MMASSDKPAFQHSNDVLLDWLHGEVEGEKMFNALADAASTPTQTAKWRALAALERATAARLAQALSAAGITDVPDPGLDAYVAERIRDVVRIPWLAQMTWLHEIAMDALAGMSADAGRLPAALRPLGEFVSAHEQALIDFAALELEDREADSLAAVRELLSRRPAAWGPD
jgi:hypothetical protein